MQKMLENHQLASSFVGQGRLRVDKSQRLQKKKQLSFDRVVNCKKCNQRNIRVLAKLTHVGVES
jgi:hypothetical protein